MPVVATILSDTELLAEGRVSWSSLNMFLVMAEAYIDVNRHTKKFVSNRDNMKSVTRAFNYVRSETRWL
jgi:hypothetical protein